MTATLNRKNNLRYWAKELGRKELAKKLGYEDTNFINQLLGKKSNGNGSFGENLARKFEVDLELPLGWFDQSFPELYEVVESDPGPQLRKAIKAKGLSYRKFGLLMGKEGIPGQSTHNWISRNGVPANKAFKAAKILGVHPSQISLIEGTENLEFKATPQPGAQQTEHTFSSVNALINSSTTTFEDLQRLCIALVLELENRVNSKG